MLPFLDQQGVKHLHQLQVRAIGDNPVKRKEKLLQTYAEIIVINYFKGMARKLTVDGS